MTVTSPENFYSKSIAEPVTEQGKFCHHRIPSTTDCGLIKQMKISRLMKRDGEKMGEDGKRWERMGEDRRGWEEMGKGRMEG